MLPHRRLGLLWTGDPDRGFAEKQTGGWGYNILPYIEQLALHDLGIGTGDPMGPAKCTTPPMLITSPLAATYCPTRRRVQVYPNYYKYKMYNGDLTTTFARSDYAGNAGDVGLGCSFP